MAATIATGMALTLVASCQPSLPTPPTGDHSGDEPMAVPYPPPPARVEMVPPQPHEGALWQDGHWQWNGDTYTWSDGRWLDSPAGATYAPPMTTRRADGQLLYYPGSWHGGTPTAADAAADANYSP